jgi:hypothetical protein
MLSLTAESWERECAQQDLRLNADGDETAAAKQNGASGPAGVQAAAVHATTPPRACSALAFSYTLQFFTL